MDRSTWRALCLAVCASVTFAVTSSAQAAGPQLVVLRSDLTDSPLGAVVDGELASALVEHAGFESSYFSPTPYSDIELAAGCHGRTDECVERVATSLNVDRLLVRELRRDAAGALVLTLVAKDEATPEARRAEGEVSMRGETRPELVVPMLVAKLYDVPVPVADAPRRDEPARPMRIAGYTAVGSSAALLLAGVASGVASKTAHEDYKDTTVFDMESAERADRRLDTAQRRARAANALFISGAAVASTGVVLLLLDRLRPERPAQVGVNVQASAEGGLLTVSGRLGRF